MTLGQHVPCNLACVGIDGQVKLAPLPPRSTVLFGIPLALAEQLQACAVQHEVDRASADLDTRLASCERPSAPAQRAVVRHGQNQPEQAQHAAAERLGLAQGQVEHEPQGQHELDRQVGIQRLPSKAAPLRCRPAREDRLVQP